MKIVGHRGAKAVAPENTLAGLRAGLQTDADYIEFDVRVTADNIPVLHHDEYVTIHGKRQSIKDHTFGELQRITPTLTTLLSVLQLFTDRHTDGGPAPFIEIKPGEPVQPIVEIVKTYIADNDASDTLLIGSKSQHILREIHAVLPDVQLIIIEPWSGVRAHRRARQVGARKVAMNSLWLWSGFIRAVSKNLELYAYTINDPILAKRWQAFGLAGIITDDPARMYSALRDTDTA